MANATFTSGPHQSVQETLPPLQYKQINTLTWGGTANTCTIVDPNIKLNSQIEAWVTGSTPAAGQWAYAITQGQCVITSNNSESSTLPISYQIF